MKVAFILENYPRLYHTFIRHEIAGLVERGARVSIFSFFRDPTPFNQHTGQLEVAQELNYFEDHVAEKRLRLARAVLKRERTIGRIGIGLHRFVERAVFGNERAADRYRSDLGWATYSLAAMVSKIQSGQFDAIHAGFGNKSATAAMLLSRQTGVPFSFETHAYDLYVDFKFANEKIREARKIFTISHYNRDYLIREHQCPPDKIEVVRVPFNKAQCDSLRKAERSSDLVVSVGRLHPIKGLTYAVEAMKLIVDRRPSVRYVIVGGGPLENELKAQVRRLGLERHVELRGDLSNPEALELVSRAAVFLLPSVIAENGDRDGVPTSLLEAMYLATPVVSSRVSGIPELVEHGVSGLLVQQRDVTGIAQCVEQLLSDDSRRDDMGLAASERVRTGFYTEDSADILMRCWRGWSSQNNAGTSRSRSSAASVEGSRRPPVDATRKGSEVVR